MRRQGRGRLWQAWVGVLLVSVSSVGQVPRPGGMGGAREKFTPSADPAALAGQVDFCIKRGVAYLYRMQGEDGSFSEPQQQYPVAGITALCTLALLAAGEPPTKAEIRKALAYLSEQNLDSTYTLGLRAAVFSQLGDAARHPLLRRDTQKLIAMQIDGGKDRGFYTYQQPPRNMGIGDLSNSQYGVLGVWYAAESGIEVPRGYWQRVEEAWTGGQNKDGGFGYRPLDERSYGSMTAAGIATLAITQDFLHASSVVNAKLGDKANQSKSAKSTDRAMEWMGKYFLPDQNPGLDTPLLDGGQRQTRRPGAFPGLDGNIENFFARKYVHYMLFGYERVGEATGRVRFSQGRWFDECAKYLISSQSGDGSWQDGTFAGPIDTAYALLFLSRGRAPVVIQKLEVDDVRWNNRTRDAASLVRWLKKQTERHLNWQITRLDYPMRDLRESPILYFASDQALTLKAEEKAKLKQYLDEGGLLLVADESERQTCAASVEKMLEGMYPRYVFRDAEVGADGVGGGHVFMSGNFPVSKLEVPVRVMGNGVRDLAVVLPKGDVPWRWQRTLGRSRVSEPEFNLVGNILVNVTGRANLRNKGVYHLKDRDDGRAGPGVVWEVSRLSYAGNWNPEPLAFEVLSAKLHNERVATLRVSVVDLEREAPKGKVAHLTATHTPGLSEREKRNLGMYLKEGGILLFDAAGGDEGCAIWAEGLLKELVPGARVRDLPLSHPIYAGVLSQAGTVEYRPGAAERVGGRRAAPRLRGVYDGERLVGVISAEDLSPALVGYPHEHIVGYTPDTARKLVTGILGFVYR